jgi:hypothetical protein
VEAASGRSRSLLDYDRTLPPPRPVMRPPRPVIARKADLTLLTIRFGSRVFFPSSRSSSAPNPHRNLAVAATVLRHCCRAAVLVCAIASPPRHRSHTVPPLPAAQSHPARHSSHAQPPHAPPRPSTAAACPCSLPRTLPHRGPRPLPRRPNPRRPNPSLAKNHSSSKGFSRVSVSVNISVSAR